MALSLVFAVIVTLKVDLIGILAVAVSVEDIVEDPGNYQ